MLWGAETVPLVVAGARLRKSWNIAAVHRLLAGGWRAQPDRVWADVHALDPDGLPVVAELDLFSDPSEVGLPDEPVRADGYLEPAWLEPALEWTLPRLRRWAQLAAETAVLQEARLAGLEARPWARSTARSESAAELLCAELSVDGLPVDRDEAERIIASFVGPRPRTEAEAVEQRRARDTDGAATLAARRATTCATRHRSSRCCAGIGVELPDTRAWRLEAIRGTHPLIDALLEWRKAERIATTFGYAWLDEHLGADGRLRGTWSGSDGAAGRMTASAGLHNMPANLRSAVVAEPGHVFVRADLGQIEPRILAAVSGDRALAKATADDDLYLPVASQLGVDRATAKVAVLGAMYGQTTGHGAVALRGLEVGVPGGDALPDGGRSRRSGRPQRCAPTAAG